MASGRERSFSADHWTIFKIPRKKTGKCLKSNLAVIGSEITEKRNMNFFVVKISSSFFVERVEAFVFIKCREIYNFLALNRNRFS